MKLLLVDDHQLFLEGITQILLHHINGLQVLKAMTVDDALDQVSLHNDIDLALVDLAMPEDSGLSFISKSKKIDDTLPIAVLSASEDLHLINQALLAGALGFIPKTYSQVELVDAIKCVVTGQVYVPAEIKKQLIAYNKQETAVQSQAEQYGITARQREVLSLVAKGFSNQRIAKLLYISEHTVKSHLKQIFQKLSCDNRINCIHTAQSLGLITL